MCIKTIDLKSKGNKKRPLHLKDCTYNKTDVPQSTYHARREKLKRFKDFTKEDKLSILNDRIFKAMFYEDKRLKIPAKFISLFFDITYEEALKQMKLIKSEINANSVEGKVNITDFVTEINENIINIEMNRNQTIERNIIYLDKLIDRKNKKGKEMKIPTSSFQINFCDFQLEGHEESIEYYLVRNDKNKILTFNKQYVMIYIQNIWKKYYNKEELSYRERLILILCATKIKVAKQIAKQDKYLMEVIEEMEELKTNRELTESYDVLLKEREGGREEGLEEGMENKQNEIVKNMYLQGLSIDLIAKCVNTSISKVKKVLGVF